MQRIRSGQCWVFVLAGGEGSRLRSLTTTADGISVPKQFCSLHGGWSLLRDALDRSKSVAAPERIRAIVAAQHLRWWSRCLTRAQIKHAVVQPANCGTACGVLLPLLMTLARDPDCTVVVLPSDHHVDDEATLASTLREAVAAVGRHPESVLMLGVEPEDSDPELGYIVPGSSTADGIAAVDAFVEKPDAIRAGDLIRRGALWNSFILVARGPALLGLFERGAPALLQQMRQALELEKHGAHGSQPVKDLYRNMAPLDFSRHILSGQESHLRVIKVPHCGWSDLGTPRSVAATLRRLEDFCVKRTAGERGAPFLDLADQQFLHPDSRRAPAAAPAGNPASAPR